MFIPAKPAPMTMASKDSTGDAADGSDMTFIPPEVLLIFFNRETGLKV